MPPVSPVSRCKEPLHWPRVPCDARGCETRDRPMLTRATPGAHAKLGVVVYDGLHTTAPARTQPLAIAFYDDHLRLHRRQEFRSSEKKPVETYYQYDNDVSTRWPVAKITYEATKELKTTYDGYGRPISGYMRRGESSFVFQYFYKAGSTQDSEVLRAMYKTSDGGPGVTISVSWCVRPRTGSESVGDWLPSDKVQAVVAVLRNQTYEIKWLYKHARGAEIEASVIDKHGRHRPCLVPVEIMEDKFGFLQKPQHVSFDCDDLLVHHPVPSIRRIVRQGSTRFAHSSLLKTPLARLLGLEKVVYHKLPTSSLRTALWRSWNKAPYVDAVSASYLDEMILRREPTLRRYWRLRDAGELKAAAQCLDEDLEQIVPAIEPSHEASETCALLIKPADLFIMGLGKDANQLTARLEDAYRDTESTTSVIFSDNGCWPDNPGGVSNCRRDLVNGHTTIRGHCLAESANDYGIPRYQIERNINTLKVLPCWGLVCKLVTCNCA